MNAMLNALSTRARATLVPTFAAVAALLALFAPALAHAADEFVPVESQVAERIPAGPFLAGAYGFIWVAVVVYVVSVARGLSRVRGEIDELRRKVDAQSR